MRRFIQDIKGKLVKLNINACGNLYKIMWGKNSRNYVGAGGGCRNCGHVTSTALLRISQGPTRIFPTIFHKKCDSFLNISQNTITKN